jgi:5-methylcytosine-specific restriction endonuclease McrA
MFRKSISRRLRFAILTRDNFRCQYCGATPSEAHLRIDHVVPVAAGGGNEEANLITSCHDCNSGKADVLLPVPLTRTGVRPLPKPVAWFITTACRRAQLKARLVAMGEI